MRIRTRTRPLVVVVALAATVLATGGAATVAQATPPEWCTDDSRQCIVEAANSYVEALVTHDVDSARLAEDVWRMTNGRVGAHGADAMRDAIAIEPVAQHGEVRWVVDGNDAVAVYELDADLSRSVQSATFLPPDAWIPAYVIERFRVEHGLIAEIEVVYWGDPTRGPRPERPYRGDVSPAGRCADGSRACQIETAGAYLAAIASHDGSAVPLAPDAWRLENGSNTGDSGEDIRGGLESPIMDVIAQLADVRWFVEGDQAVAMYTLFADGTGLTGAPSGPEPLLTPAYVAERFRIQDGLIKEIEAVFWIDPPGSRPDPRPTDG